MRNRDEIILDVLEKGYWATVKESWQRTRGKGIKSKLQFTVGIIGFTVGFILLRCWQAVSETILEIQTLFHSREDNIEK